MHNVHQDLKCCLQFNKINYPGRLVWTLPKPTETHLAGDFVWGDFVAGSPVPHIDHHVVLRANGNNVLQVGRKSLKQCKMGAEHFLETCLTLAWSHGLINPQFPWNMLHAMVSQTPICFMLVWQIPHFLEKFHAIIRQTPHFLEICFMPWSDKPPTCLVWQTPNFLETCFMPWFDKPPFALCHGLTNPCMLHAMVWQTPNFLGTCFMPWSDKPPSASCHGLTPPPPPLSCYGLTNPLFPWNLLHAMIWQNGHVIYNSAFPSVVVLVLLVGWLNGQCLGCLIWSAIAFCCSMCVFWGFCFFVFCTCGFVCGFFLCVCFSANGVGGGEGGRWGGKVKITSD